MGDWRRLLGVVLPGLLVVVGCGMVMGIHLELVVVGLALALFAVVACTAALLAVRHVRLTARLRAGAVRGLADGIEFEVVPGAMPFVAGLVHPRIFLDDDVFDGLDPGQRRAVLLHEQAHRDHRDPARLVVLEAVRRCLAWIPGVSAAERSARAQLEILADQRALALGATRRDLAGALLHLAPTPATTGASFGAVAEQRIRALLDGRDAVPGRPRWVWGVTAAVLLVGVTVCLSMSSTAHPELMWLLRCVEGACTLP